MNHSFLFVTWWPVAELMIASSGSSQMSAPLSSCVKYSPLCRDQYRPIRTPIITNSRNRIASVTEIQNNFLMSYNNRGFPRVLSNLPARSTESKRLYAFRNFSSSISGGGLVSVWIGGCVTGSTPQKSSVSVAKISAWINIKIYKENKIIHFPSIKSYWKKLIIFIQFVTYIL